MALQKDIYGNGVVCSYHKISGVLSSWNNNETLAVDVTSYVNSDMRSEEKDDISNKEEYLNSRAVRSFQVMIPYTNDWSLHNLYSMLKDTDELSNATDC